MTNKNKITRYYRSLSIWYYLPASPLASTGSSSTGVTNCNFWRFAIIFRHRRFSPKMCVSVYDRLLFNISSTRLFYSPRPSAKKTPEKGTGRSFDHERRFIYRSSSTAKQLYGKYFEKIKMKILNTRSIASFVSFYLLNVKKIPNGYPITVYNRNFNTD